MHNVPAINQSVSGNEQSSEATTDEVSGNASLYKV